MAVTKSNQRYTVKVEYKPEFDTTGELALAAYSQTFTKVSEDATPAQLKDFADALMSLTVYAAAPYKVYIIDTAELTAD